MHLIVFGDITLETKNLVYGWDRAVRPCARIWQGLDGMKVRNLLRVGAIVLLGMARGSYCRGAAPADYASVR
ncbi:MAG: hypothetical protein ACI8PP_002604 [Candidatus Pseudothioglobus sp.]|jgi:hypothetical protein